MLEYFPHLGDDVKINPRAYRA